MAVKNIASDIRHVGPPIQSKAVTNPVDGSTSNHADYTAPTGLYIRGVNISVAGLLKLQNIDGTSVAEYFVQGWNPCTLSTKIIDTAANTATVLKVALTATSVQV